MEFGCRSEAVVVRGQDTQACHPTIPPILDQLVRGLAHWLQQTAELESPTHATSTLGEHFS